MAGPVPSTEPLRGDARIQVPGFSYLPRFLAVQEASELATFFATLRPLWETRHAPGATSARGGSGRLTRPVYWLGGWQFAALGYYAEPDHREHRVVRAEPFPPVMRRLLERLRPELARHGDTGPLPNTCLINFYGRERPEHGPPVDTARLRMHRDAEPGAVVMFSVGQPAQFEFVEPDAPAPAHSQWVRNRSVLILSGSEYKDRLYHRVTRVRYGQDPVLTSQLPDFEVRRVSVSFRHVPESFIVDAAALPPERRAIVAPYLELLAQHSAHFSGQLDLSRHTRGIFTERE